MEMLFKLSTYMTNGAILMPPLKTISKIKIEFHTRTQLQINVTQKP
jgi:hypothetical protein